MGVALEAVTVQPTPHARPRIERISPHIRRVIDRMVHEGQARKEAAANEGITDEAARQALKQPKVLAYMNTQLQVIRTSAAARTVARVDRLADEAESEHVKLDSNKWLAGLEGISPVSRSEQTINHKGAGPGLVIQIANVVPGETGPLIPSLPHEQGLLNAANGLDDLVPHPAWGTPQISGDSAAPEAEGEGKNGDRRKA